MFSYFRAGAVVVPALVLIQAVSATTVPRISFEELTDKSELVVSGKVTRSWTSWDTEHKYIWTHYELSVSAAHKGSAMPVIEFAELGGEVEGLGMSIAGSVQYKTGDEVLIFLSRQPNGYLRTTGWGQGKYSVDSAGRLHGDTVALRAVESVSLGSAPAAAASSPRSLEGLSLREAGQRIAARVQSRGVAQ